MNTTSTRQRLQQCFQAVFPNLDEGSVATASTATVATWDSVAQVTLISLVEEEFGLVLPVEQYGDFTSFEAFLNELELLR